MDNPILIVAMRYLHIVSAIVAVGGLTFSILCLKPAAAKLDEAVRDGLLAAVRARFVKVQWVALLVLVATGVFGWVSSNQAYNAAGKLSQPLIGTKVLLAFILIAVVWARGANIIKSDRVAGMINVHLAAIIILLAAVLRTYRMAHG